MAEPSTSQRIDRFLSDAERISGLDITVHDPTGVFLGLLPGKWYSHRNPLCVVGRGSTPGFEERCQAHCWQAMDRRAADTGEPFIHSCWKGGAEACAPVFRDGVHRLTIFGGVLAAGPEAPSGLDQRTLRTWRTLQPPDPARLSAAAQVLMGIGHGLLAMVDAHRRRSPSTRRDMIERFLEDELHGDASIDRLAGHLGLSPSRAAHVVREQFGVSYGAVLQERRLTRAQLLLATGDEPIRVVAARCGFMNQHWFSRLFHRQTGMPPGAWRSSKRPPA